MQVKFQFLVLQIVCGGRGNFFFNLLKSFLKYFTTSILVSGIQNGGAQWLAFWVILWAPPLILDGYVMNDIWTIVKTKITCVTYRASPCGLAINLILNMFHQSGHIRFLIYVYLHTKQHFLTIYVFVAICFGSSPFFKQTAWTIVSTTASARISVGVFTNK